MTVATSVIKLTAKTTLKDNWVAPIAAVLTLVFSVFICIISADYLGYISTPTVSYVVLSVMGVFLLLPLFFGIVRVFWRMLFSTNDRPIAVFYYFSGKQYYRRALKLSLKLTFRFLIVGALMFLPAFVTDIFSGVKIYDWLNISIPLWTSNLFYATVFLRTVAFVLLLFYMARYYLAPFLMVADENMDIDEAIHMSVIIAKNTLLDFLYLMFSFFGWILLSLLCFPLLFTAPYILTSIAVHVRFAIADYNKKTERNVGFNGFPTYEGV